MKGQEFILRPGELWGPVRANAMQFLSMLPETKPWRITIAQHRETRSDLQNRALWGVAYRAIADATGHDPDDLHDFFLGEFFGWEVVEIFGQKKRIPKRRSSKLETTEFAEFFDFIQRRAAEGGVYVPDPDPNWRDAA